jgi:hypothetical protein
MRVAKLKMFGLTQEIRNGKFRFRFPEIGATAVIFEETDEMRCCWEILESGHMAAVGPASGFMAARNAAQNWLVERASKTLALAARSVR